MALPIKTNKSRQISWCLRIKDKNGKSYENQNREQRRRRKK